MKKLGLFKTSVLTIAAIVLAPFSNNFAQTPGMIILPADAAGQLVLDPNGDGYTSTTTAGFMGNDQINSEIPFQTLIPAGNEPNSDLGPGPDCGFTDFVESLSGGIDPVFHYSNGTNWMFRFRMAGVAPNAKSYSVLIDTDGLFGPADVGTYTSTNPGFEIEIVLATKFGVRVYDHDLACGSNLVASYGPGRIQKSIAASAECSSMNFFLDCYVDWADITAHFGVDENSFMRYALVDNMAADKSSICNPSSISDLGAVDDNACGSLEECFTEVILNQPPCQPSTTLICTYSDCPVISGLPLALGTTSVSGTSTEADGTTINVYVNGSIAGSTTVAGGTWTVSPIPALVANDIVEATAVATDEVESGTNCNNVTVAGATCTDPVTSITLCNANKAFEGYCSAIGATINLYDATGALLNPTSGTVWNAGTGTITTTTIPSALGDPNNNFLWRCIGSGSTTSCTAGGGPCITDGNYYITATLPGQCESEPYWFCIGLSTTTADPIISGTVTTASTAVSGSLVGSAAANNGVDIYLYINGSQAGTTSTTNNNGDWTISGLSFNQCDEVKVIAVDNVGTESCPSAEVIQIIAGAASPAPEITGDYCTSTGITTVTGTSTGADGTIIQVYENGVAEGSTVTVSGGVWTATTGINIASGSTITATAQDTSACETTSAASTGVVVGNQSTNPVTIDPVSIVEGTTTITGTGTNGDIITLYIDGYPVFQDLAETTLATTTVSGGTWSISTIFSEAIYANATITATATTGALCESVEYDPTPTICSQPDQTLTVNPDNTAVCSGSTVANIEVVNSESGVIYQLYNNTLGANTGSSVLGTGGTITMTTDVLTANATIAVLAIKFPYDGTCTMALNETVAVTVNAYPNSAVTLGGTSTVCENTSVNITVDASEVGITYQLRDDSDDSNVGSPVAGTGGTINLPTGSLTSTTTYNVLATGAAPSSCSAELSGTITITVTPAPSAPTAGSNSPVCEGGTINLTSTTVSGATYSWTGPNGFTSTSQNPSIAGVTTAAAGTYSVTAIVGGCSSLPATTSVTVTTAPDAGTVSGTTSICEAGTSTLTSSGDAGGSWSSSNTSVATVNATTGLVTGVSVGTATITYTVTGTGGCTDATATASVTVTAAPDAGTVSGTTSICESGSSTLTSSGDAGGSWSSSNTSVATVNSSTGLVTGVSAGTATITYTVTGAGGCTDATATASVTVTTAPDAGTVSGTTSICEAGTSTLTSSGDAGGSWSSSNTSVATVNATTGLVTGVSAGTATITYTVTGTGGCTDATATASVTVTAAPDAGTVSGTTSICEAGTSILTSTGDAGGSWSSSNTSVATVNATTGLVTGVSAGTATITYTVTGTGGCTDATATASVTVTASPDAGTVTGTTSICESGTSTLTSSGDTGGSWSSSNTSVATVNSSTGLVTGVSSGTATITYSVTGAGGCTDATATASVTVTAAPDAGTVSGTTSICEAGTSTLTSSGDAGGSWSSSNTSVATVNASTGLVTGLSAGTATITYTVTGTGGCTDATATASVTVTSCNTAPVATDNATTTAEDNGVTLNVTSDDTDSDGTIDLTTVDLDPSTPGIQSTFTSPEGTWTVDASGNVTFTPNADYNGTAVITYTVNDNDGATSNTATITVTVTPVADAPSQGNETLTINEDDPTTTSTVLTTNNTDPDGTTTSVTTIVSSTGGGTTIISGGGTTIDYTPAPNFTGIDTVIYEVCDGGTPTIDCVNDTLFVTVNPINDAPSQGNETMTITEDDPTATSPVLTGNNVDPDGTTTSVTTIISSTGGGTTVISGVGTTIDYTPASNFTGVDTVIYEVCDNGTPLPAECVMDTLFVTVDPVNDAPGQGNETMTISEDDPTTTSPILTANNIDPDGTTTSVTTIVSSTGGGTTVISGGGTTIDYTPATNFNGVDTVIYEVCDNGNPLPAECVMDTLFITVDPVNDPPVIDNENISIAMNSSGGGDLTDIGDSDIDGNLVVNTTPLSGPSNGTIVINPDGTYTYTPTAGYSGSDQVVVEICDDGTPLPAICVNDTIFITVTPTNPPVATDNSTTTLEDNSVTVNVSNDDTDSDGTIDDATVDLDPSTPGIQSTFTSPEGTWTVDASGNVTFTPNADYNGTAVINYTVNDNDGATSNTATITVTVTLVNDGPVVDNENDTTPEDTPVSGDLTDAGDSDVDGNLVVNTTPLSGPSNGTIVINPDGTYTYTPDPDYNGLDTVVVEICDDGTPLPAICVNDTIFVTVTPVNDAPSQGNETMTITEDDPTTTSPTLTTNNIDPDGTTTSVTTIVSSTGGGTTVISGGGTTIDYTPASNFTGVDTVIYEVCDNGTPLPAECVMDTLFVTVDPVNDAPGQGNETMTISEDDPTTTSPVLTANNIDPDGSTTSVTTIVSSTGGGTTVISGGGTTIDYTPATNFNGVDTVIYEVCDNGTPLPAECVMDTLFVTVDPVNDPPVIDNENISIAMNSSGGGDLTDIGDSDIDGNLVVNTTPLSGPSNGTIVINPDGTYTYTPTAGYSGSDQVVVEICDDGTPLPAICVNDTIFITVTPTNPPVATDNATTTTEDNGVTLNVTSDDTDSDGTIDPTTVDLDPSTPGIQSTYTSPEGTWTVDASGNVTFTPNADYNGTAVITYTVNDNDGATSNTATITVTVTPVADAPSQGNETLTINEDDPTTTSSVLTTNNTDPDGTTTSVTTIVSSTGGGTTVVSGGGTTIDYTPATNFTGIDTVIYEVCDGGTPTIDCVNDTLFVTVNPINDAPSQGNETMTITEDDPTTTSPVLTTNNIDPDGTTTSVTTIVSSTGGGTTVISGGGTTIDYTPASNFTGIDTVIYEVCDNGTPLPAECVMDTLFVTVDPVNDAPVIDNEYLSTTINTPVNGDLTDAGDSDVDGNLVVNTTPLGGPTNGTIVINPDGTYTYTPNTGYLGTDTVVVEICDDGIPLPVICVNDTIFIEVLNTVPPVATDNNTTTTEDNGVTLNVSNDDTDSDGTIDNTTVDLDPTTPGIQSTFTSPEGIWSVDANGDVTFTPNPDYNGTAVIDYTVDDNDGATSNIATITVTVTPVNDGPIVDNEYLITGVNTSIGGDLTDAGDSDVDGNLVVNTTPLGGPTNGTIVINPDGTFTYTPNTGYLGNDTVVVEICDDGTPLPAICVNDTIFITVVNCAITDPNADCDSDGLTNGEETTGIDDPGTTDTPGGVTDPLDPDTDGDGVTDGTEGTDGTDPNDPCDYLLASVTLPQDVNWSSADCDGDGVTNGTEITDGTDPSDPCDLIVANQDTTPDATWLANDCDSDGLTNEEETTGTDDPGTTDTPGGVTDPLDPDTDGDGVTDGTEGTDGTNPNDPCDYLPASVTLTPDVAWSSADCDGDGVTNGTEITDGTDPSDPCDLIVANQDTTPDATWLANDCDSDGLTNEEETTGTDDPGTTDTPGGVTDPLDPDTDGDGVTDGTEGTDGTNPNDPCDYLPASVTLTPDVAWSSADCDGDGVTNGTELTDGTDPNDPCDLIVANQDTTPDATWLANDCDSDGLTNEEETTGTDDPGTTDTPGGVTDPLDPDTDGDGVTDGTEGTDGTNPNDPCDYLLASVTLTPDVAWSNADCDGDGVTNGTEQTDGTDLNDPCDYNTASVTLTPDAAWLSSDCDGDGVTNGTELTDGTDPNDPCDLIVANQDTTPDATWLANDCDSDGLTNEEETTGIDDPGTTDTPGGVTDPLDPDTDGDGVTDGTEGTDGTDPNDPCDYDVNSITLAQSGAWNAADCDGDGVTNGSEITDGTDPNDPCDLVVANQDTTPDVSWTNADCDGDGVTNGTELVDGTDPNDPCDLSVDSQDTAPTSVWLNADCDGDGVTNGTELTDGTDPNDPCDLIVANQDTTPDAAWLANDCDNDGLTNEEETTGVDDPSTPDVPGGVTDPLDPDTDGDGVTDSTEGTDGTDPNDPCDFEESSITMDVTTTVSCGLNIPDAFSPNNDGVNDVFVIDGIDNYPNSSFTVLNRWGNKVYESAGYQNDWDGTNQFGVNVGGSELPVGTYFYILDLGEEGPEGEQIYKGYIYLNR